MEDRTIKVAARIAEAAAQFVLEEANTDPLITITRADVSPDNRNATIFFTTIPETKQDDALLFMKRSGTDLRHFLMKRLRLHHIPHLEFMIDYGERHRQHIDEIVRETGTESTLPEAEKDGSL